MAMRRIHRLITAVRAIAANTTAVRAIAANTTAVRAIAPNTTTHQHLHQTTLYPTISNLSTPSSQSQLFSVDHSHHRFVAGTMFFSVAASVAEDVQAKETTSSSPKQVTLYQYEACPFCNKVKAFLDYTKIPYKVVEVNPISKKEIKWSDYKKVPILVVDGQEMVDSSVIIDQLSQKLHPGLLPGESISNLNEEENKWRGWVDHHLVHVLSPNIYRSPSEALESFDYITSHGNFSFFERMTGKYVGAAAMYFVSKKLKKKHNIIDERATLYEAAETWVEALKGREFLGGKDPNLADLAVFGVLRPIRYLQSGRDMVENTRIGEWYSRMKKIVGESSRIPA